MRKSKIKSKRTFSSHRIIISQSHELSTSSTNEHFTEKESNKKSIKTKVYAGKFPFVIK